LYSEVRMMFHGLLSKRIFDEAHDFQQTLPLLLKDEAMVGRFVVFRQGQVHAAAETFEAAYQKALELFGANVPFFVGLVTTAGEVMKSIPNFAVG
jgi:hypothetical protein